MIETSCKQCGKKIIRRGSVPGVFCSLDCKGEWQQAQKPVGKDWLYQKYVVEGLSTYQIGSIVNRDPKRVWEWLRGYDIKTRTQPGGEGHGRPKPFWDKDWLCREYLEKQKSAKEIADGFGCGENNVLYFLHKHNIPVRSASEVRAIKYWGLRGAQNGMYGVRGVDHPNWLGGFTPARQALYSSIEWASASLAVWARDCSTCRRCGDRYSLDKPTFHIHHIVNFSVEQFRADVNNLVLLCVKCHRWVHSKNNIDGEFITEWKGGE